MGILNALQGSTGSSFSNATSANSATSQSRTYGAQATQASIANANTANAIGMQNWQTAADFNAIEAQKQREWQERMANTVYQRTVKDMIAAGINPVLAANMGLGTASVGSGASASMGNADSYMASAYADQISSAESQGHSESYGKSYSESGLATGLQLLGQAISGVIEKMNSGTQISIALDGFKNWYNDYDKDMDEAIENAKESGNKTTETYLENHKKETNNWLLKFMNKLQSDVTGISPQQIDLEAPLKNHKKNKG